ncbi:MAG: hypothetical protein AAF539_12245, partial [Planctomycetota bacterium]
MSPSLRCHVSDITSPISGTSRVLPPSSFQRSLLCVLICVASQAWPNRSASADGPSLLRMFQPRGRVAADATSAYKLTEVEGPWMILAYTFVGEGSQGRAQKLVLEIRENLNLPAFVHEQDFDFSGDVKLGAAIKQTSYQESVARQMRYRNEIRYQAHAVLVGEYDRVDHPQIESDLARVKSASSVVLGDEK